MRSPGRPPVARREHRQRFWAAIGRGSASEDAGVEAGVSPAVGSRWFRECGGMPPSDFRPHSGRYLSFFEREEIAICRAYGYGVREIARYLGRSPSTISRELRRNAGTRGGTLVYRAVLAQWHRDRWATAWSPEQIARRLAVDFPDDESMRVSHEAIYQALYVQGRGALKRELVACLRTGRALRVPRARARRRRDGMVTPEVMISARPALRPLHLAKVPIVIPEIPSNDQHHQSNESADGCGAKPRKCQAIALSRLKPPEKPPYRRRCA
jgi:transposase, IS30 family